jgi:2-keto-4-pentenoate hydratase/2-oxohepta-3-ene-1,7-dioic acid hydratase in catechol pathway
MKLYTFEIDGEPRIGAEQEGRLVDLNAAYRAAAGTGDGGIAGSMLEFIAGAETTRRRADQALAHAARRRGTLESRQWTHALDVVRLLAPIPRPGKILCSGLNYRSHVEENPGARFLEDPRFFSKVPSVVVGAGDPIRHPGARFQVDFEVELGVVIGSPMARASQATAMSHVFGYTVFHDVSSRFIQFKENNETMGKNFDTFAPMGPCLVTADEIPDPRILRLTTRLNGEIMQDRTNEDWCFPLPRLLEWLSMAMTLEPGDVVTTGTPAGIGYFRKPQVFLKPGDVCELTISSIGTLTNPVVAADHLP